MQQYTTIVQFRVLFQNSQDNSFQKEKFLYMQNFAFTLNIYYNTDVRVKSKGKKKCQVYVYVEKQKAMIVRYLCKIFSNAECSNITLTQILTILAL